MDFLDPKKRRAHRVKLILGYGLMAVALAFASIILLYQSYGYDYDRKSGEIVQNGLVFIDAHPAGATAYLNGEGRGRTDLRLDVRAGNYRLELQEPNYRSWQRDFVLEGGSIERFIYPFLFPTDLKTTDMQTYADTPSLMTQSPNRQWVVIQRPGSFERFDLIEIAQTDAQSTTLALPEGLLEAAGSKHILSVIEWSSDNRRFILQHEHEAGVEFSLVDIESPSSSVNLTRTFETPFTTLTLRDKRFDQYYLYNETRQRLYTARLRDASVALYQSEVLAFRPHGSDVVAFITGADASKGRAWLNVREGDDVYAIREIDAGSRYYVDLARFENSWYIAAGAAEEQKVYLFKNPVATIKDKGEKLPLPIAVLRNPGATEAISFSTNTRFIASQSGDNFAVYDAETDRQYRYDAGLELSKGQTVGWMDGHRLTTVVNGQVVVFDYDGTNKQTLNSAFDGTEPVFDNDYEAIFTLSPSQADNKVPALVRTELRVEN